MLRFRSLKADEIDCRVSTVSDKGCSLLLYKDARVDQNILDETVGPENWQRRHELINGNLFCSVGIHCQAADGTYQWVWKQDVGTESYTEKEKGEASDSFKRACFNWGIGRELYTAPFIWIPAGKVKIEEIKGKLTTRDRFYVSQIEIADGKIVFLILTNKKGESVYSFGEPADAKEEVKDTISEEEALSLWELLKTDQNREYVMGKYNVGDFRELTKQQYVYAVTMYKRRMDALKEKGNG